MRVQLLAVLASAVLSAAPAAAAIVGGTVTTSTGAPLANTSVDVLAAGTSTVTASGVSDSGGSYQVSVAPGSYDVRVSPEPSSGYLVQTLAGRSISGDTTLDLLLVPASAAAYGGKVVTATGAGVPGVQLKLDGFTGSASGETDEGGAFSLAVPPGSYDRRLEFSKGDTLPPDLPAGFSLAFTDPIEIAADLQQTITLPATVVLSGTVVAPGGQPLDGAEVIATFADVRVEGVTGAQGLDTFTDASGAFSTAMFPGTATLLVLPPPGSPLGLAMLDVEVAESTSLSVTLPDTPYGGFVETAAAGPAADVIVTLEDANGFSRSGLTDSDGVFGFPISPGTYRRSLANSSSPSSIPGVPRDFFLLLPGTVDVFADTMETLVMPATFQFSGSVVDPAGRPVVGAEVSSLLFDVAADAVGGFETFMGVTDADGKFNMPVFPGMGAVQVIPAPGSGLGAASASVVVTSDTVHDFTVPDTVYSGEVTTADGTGIGDVTVELFAGVLVASAVTGPAGDFAIPVAPGMYERHLEYAPVFPVVPDLPQNFVVIPNGTINLTASASEVLALPPGRRLAVTVVDPSGAAVDGASVSSEFFDVLTPAATGTQPLSATTDANGDFVAVVFPGSGALEIAPPVGSSLPSVRVNGVAVTDSDVQLGILLQANAKIVSAVLAAMETLSTDSGGTGPTLGDPVTTAVTTPVGGMVSIFQSPVLIPAPAGFRFLGRQVGISAPASTPDMPLIIVFALDASEVPAGDDETTLEVFKNDALVPGCTGTPGVASPDPCISSRERLTDGDIRLTILTSTASSWNLGASLPGCVADTECDDGIACTFDLCLAGVCSNVPDDAACADSDPCNGAEFCDQAAGCTAGTPVVCLDDGNPCTDDRCAPDGSCGVPIDGACDDGNPCTTADRCESGVCVGGPVVSCPDDADPCTDDVCNPDSGTCGVAVPGACDDGDPCTGDDQCEGGHCGGVPVSPDPYAHAACELNRIPSTSCDPDQVDPGLAARLDSRTNTALAYLDAASGAVSQKQQRRALDHTTKQLTVMLKRINRMSPARASDDCKATLSSIVRDGQAAVDAVPIASSP
jgi:hypothetical protein